MPPSALLADQHQTVTDSKSVDLDVAKILVHGDREGTLKIFRLPTFANKEEEFAVEREHMAAAFRMFGRKGFGQGAAGHISLRDPRDPHLMWINPVFQPYISIQPEDLVCIDHDGFVTKTGAHRLVNSAGVWIHLGLHKARADINAACHTHSINGTAYSAFSRPLQMITQDACGFVDNCAIVPFNGIVTAEEEGQRIAKYLGAHKTCAILANHGLLTVGETVAEAAYKFIVMDKVCGVQLLADAAEHQGVQKNLLTEEEARKNSQLSDSREFLYANFLTELQELYLAEGKPYKHLINA